MMQKLNERTVTGPNVLRCGGVPAVAKARETGIINAGRISTPISSVASTCQTFFTLGVLNAKIISWVKLRVLMFRII
jgi:hypothetical protein